MICRFVCRKYELFNGGAISVKSTNTVCVKPHILKVNGKDYLLFVECGDVFINSYFQSIKLKDLERYLKETK